MKQTKVLVLSHETFSCSWNGKLQPVGSCAKDAVKKYIIDCINMGNAKIEQFKVRSNMAEYNAADFIKQ